MIVKKRSLLSIVEIQKSMSISIKCNFSLPTDSSNSSPNDQRVISKSFDASNCKESRIGLPEGTEATKVKSLFLSYLIINNINYNITSDNPNYFETYIISPKMEITLIQACMTRVLFFQNLGSLAHTPSYWHVLDKPMPIPIKY